MSFPNGVEGYQKLFLHNSLHLSWYIYLFSSVSRSHWTLCQLTRPFNFLLSFILTDTEMLPLDALSLPRPRAKILAQISDNRKTWNVQALWRGCLFKYFTFINFILLGQIKKKKKGFRICFSLGDEEKLRQCVLDLMNLNF